MEIILVDDASGDNTLELLQHIAGEFGVPEFIQAIIMKKNCGAATARNVGWSAAKGQFVAFLDSDDSWHPQKLGIQYRFMKQHPDIAVSGHLHIVTLQAMASALLPQAFSFIEIGLNHLLWRNRFVTSSVMLRRNLPIRFSEGQRHMEDHRLWLDIARSGHRLARIELPLAAHHKADFGAGGLSANLVAMEKTELANYDAMKHAGCINGFMHTLLICWSILKFVRRVAIVCLRRAMRSA